MDLKVSFDSGEPSKVVHNDALSSKAKIQVGR